jgi:hypothetical protein
MPVRKLGAHPVVPDESKASRNMHVVSQGIDHMPLGSNSSQILVDSPAGAVSHVVIL